MSDMGPAGPGPASSSLADGQTVAASGDGGALFAPRSAILRNVMPASRRLKAAQLGLVAVALVLWQVIVTAGLATETILPSPTSVASGLRHILADESVRTAFLRTLNEFIAAFMIGTIIGAIVGIALGLSSTLEEAYLRPILFVMSTPKVVFLPLFTLIFGLTTKAIIAFGAFEAFFYVAVNVVGAVSLVDEKYLRLARSYSAPWRLRILEIILPATAPGLVASIWFGVKHALLGVLIAEFYASSGGVGFLVTTYTQTLHPDYSFGVIAVISIFAIIVGSLFSAVERRLQRGTPQ